MAITPITETGPGPWGDETLHLDTEQVRAAFEALEVPAKDSAVLAQITLRLPDGVRATPAEVEITAAEGLVGDRWAEGKHGPDDQITIMRACVASLVANGQETSLAGDNLLIDLDLSAENLPTGTQITIGETLVEVTQKPHNGCAQFAQRFGKPALRLVNGNEYKHLRLRGIHVRVVNGGTIKLGDSVVVLRG